MEKTVVIPVEGMTCGGCVRSVTRALERLEGVRSVEVSLEKHRAEVSYDDALASPGGMTQAIEAAGFSVPA